MKARAIFLLSGAMFLSGLSAFASSGNTARMEQNLQSLQQWAGKSVAQLVKTFGTPSYTASGKNGTLVYNYVLEPQHVSPVATYQFVIGPNKKVNSARMSF